MDMFANEKTPRQDKQKVDSSAPTATVATAAQLPCLHPKLFSANDGSQCYSPRMSECSEQLTANRLSRKDFVANLRRGRVLKCTTSTTDDECGAQNKVPLRFRECAELRLPTGMPRLVEVAPMEAGESLEASFKAYYELIKRNRA
eukprot:GEMP01019941.1.p2 GENE.GEMP01019941.1~~GEMP01019941.1.p2  ORF type:complete len:145 (+),score=35.26 GEMP01019941.1:213-647(+)